MKTVVNWVLSVAAAYLITWGLDAALPPDLSRRSVLTCGGLGAIVWIYLIDRPLDRWSARS